MLSLIECVEDDDERTRDVRAALCDEAEDGVPRGRLVRRQRLLVQVVVGEELTNEMAIGLSQTRRRGVYLAEEVADHGIASRRKPGRPLRQQRALAYAGGSGE